MNSLVSASSLVPSRKELIQPLEDQISSIGLDKLITTLILPPDEEVYTTNLVGVVQHFKKKDDVPTKELTTGVIETFREYIGLKQMAEDHQDAGISILKRIAKWGIKRIVKWVFKFVFKMMYRFARWVFKEVITRGVKALIEWVVRPVIMSALEFIGFNPELWPFIAVAGGVAGIGIAGWNMFFAKPKDSKLDTVASKADSLLTDQAEVARGIQEVPLGPEVTQGITGKPTVAQRAAAPLAAGAPVAIPSGDDKSIMSLIASHEGVRTTPYKDSQGLWTIGVGHLIGDGKSLPDEWNRVFSMDEVMALFAQDYPKYKQAAMQIPGFDSLSAGGKAALIDMTFNLGASWWHKWPSFTAAMQKLDMSGVVDSLKNSAWFTQVGRRTLDDISLLSSSLSTTKSTNDTLVKNNPGVTVAQNQGSPQQQTSQGSPTAVPIRIASNTQKNYIKGPQGSIVAVS